METPDTVEPAGLGENEGVGIDTIMGRQENRSTKIAGEKGKTLVVRSDNSRN